MVKKVSLAIWIVGAIIVAIIVGYSVGKFGAYGVKAVVFEILMLAIGFVAGTRLERHRRA
jgi:hypothetical protein